MGSHGCRHGKHLRRAPRVRAAEKMLAAVIIVTVSFMVPVQILWDAAMEPSAVLLFIGLGLVAWSGAVAPRRIAPGRPAEQAPVVQGRRLANAAEYLSFPGC